MLLFSIFEFGFNVNSVHCSPPINVCSSCASVLILEWQFFCQLNALDRFSPPASTQHAVGRRRWLPFRLSHWCKLECIKICISETRITRPTLSKHRRRRPKGSLLYRRRLSIGFEVYRNKVQSRPIETRTSADADKPAHIMTSYWRSTVTLALSSAVSEIFNV